MFSFTCVSLFLILIYLFGGGWVLVVKLEQDHKSQEKKSCKMIMGRYKNSTYVMKTELQEGGRNRERDQQEGSKGQRGD